MSPGVRPGRAYRNLNSPEVYWKTSGLSSGRVGIGVGMTCSGLCFYRITLASGWGMG